MKAFNKLLLTFEQRNYSVMSIHPINPDKFQNALSQAKIDLAAAHRLAVYHDLEEGIDNHFTVCVPDSQDQYLILPFGLHWSEARASDMIIFNKDGETLEGEGIVERSAQCIHAPIHRITGAKVVLHTHQTWAVALNMLEDNRLIPACQTSAFLYGHIAYDDDYLGTADTLEEGERLGNLLGNNAIMFMKNHGVLVAGETIAKTYRTLYMLERVCKAQILAMSTGVKILPISDEVIAKVQAPDTGDRHHGQRHHLYFEAMKRVLNRVNPGYQE